MKVGPSHVELTSGAKVEGSMCVKDDTIVRKAIVSTYECYVT